MNALVKAPYYVRFAAELAVMDLKVTADAVTCQVYLETGIPFLVSANFDGNHANPYITNVEAFLLKQIGDNENKMIFALDEDDKRAFALAIEQQIARDHKRSNTPISFDLTDEWEAACQ